ncbi:hypothetical protein chiPu_0002921 [Chiloscyllium punctatum]|uniref:Uncharacterized protein n=1 Tax=Chiloscyllium punctatum TaxID=137246 RepID=A0A401S2B5_CHIPU|nr:hypothetical protein [Chiloscyllium punctatum]
MMDSMHAELITKFKSIISEMAKMEVTTALQPLEGKVSSQCGTILDLECSANEQDNQIASLQANVNALSATGESLTKKCENLETRSRWNNIRFMGLPEGLKGPRSTEFMAQLLQDLLSIETKPVLDSAHHTLHAKPKEGKLFCPMVIRVNQFQVRNHILRCTGNASFLVYNGKRIFIFPEFTLTVAKQRVVFAKVKKKLHSCPNIKFGLCYPAILHIILPSGLTYRYDDSGRAMHFVNKNLKRSQIDGWPN